MLSFISHKGMNFLAYVVLLSLQNRRLLTSPDSTSMDTLELLWSNYLASRSILVKTAQRNGLHSSAGMSPSQLLDTTRNYENRRVLHHCQVKQRERD